MSRTTWQPTYSTDCGSGSAIGAQAEVSAFDRAQVMPASIPADGVVDLALAFVLGEAPWTINSLRGMTSTMHVVVVVLVRGIRNGK